MDDCIFCRIARKEAPAYVIWEDEHHMAFLSIFPNTEGFTVVIPKEHYPSYVFQMPELAMTSLVLAARTVAGILDTKFDDVGRTGLMFEGFGVDHAHAKLFPMHGTKSDSWKPRHSNVNTYFTTYEGYISSHDSQRADDEQLAATARKLTT